MKYYLLQIVGDVEPFLFGPYTTEEERDANALKLRADDGEKENGLYRIESQSPVAVDCYSGAELDPEPTLEKCLDAVNQAAVKMGIRRPRDC